MENPAFRAARLSRELAACPLDRRSIRVRCERELVRLYHTEPSARECVIEAFTPFAMSFAHRLKRGEEPIDDLRQVAMVGLLKALDRFQPDRGDSFVAFAAPTILGELRRHYRDTGWAVHVPRSRQELVQRLQKAERRLAAATGRPVTAQQLADDLELPVETVVEGRVAAGAMRTDSIDRPVTSDREPGARTLAETRGDIDDGYERVEDRAVLEDAMASLDERDQLVLRLRYREELSQSAIGSRIGVSQMQVSRILRRIESDLADNAGGLGAATAA